MLVGIHEVGGRKGPELPLVTERVVPQRGQHDVDELLEVLAVVLVHRGVPVPRPDRVQILPNAEIVHPAGLVAANETEPEAPAEHVVHGRDGLRGAKRVVGGGDEAAGDDPELPGVLTEPHPHESGLVADLESLDLEMVLRMAEAGVPGFVGEAHVLRDLVEHPPVKPGILAGHPRFELRSPADCAIHEEVELHGRTLARSRGIAFQS